MAPRFLLRTLPLLALLALLPLPASTHDLLLRKLSSLRRRAPHPLALPPAHRASANSSVASCKAALSTCLAALDAGQSCRTIPVPPRSRVPLLPPGAFRLTTLRTDGVFLYDDGAYLSLILFRNSRLALIDFPDSVGSNTPSGTMTLLTDAAEKVLDGAKPSRIDMIYTHAHYDHIGAGTRFFNYAKSKFPDVPLRIWGSRITRDAIRRSPSKRAPEPTEFVGTEPRTLFLGGGLRVEMRTVVGHTQSDMIAYIPRSGGEPSIAMLVDVIFPRWSPFLLMAVTEDLGFYIDVHEELLRLDFDIFIGGHLKKGSRVDVERNLRFTNDLVATAAKVSKSLTDEQLQEAGLAKFVDPEAVEFENVWFAIIGVVRELEIDGCYRILLEKWGCKLAGMDLTLRSHCDVAFEYNLLDV